MSKVKQQQLDQNFLNGWLPIGAITRVSDTTATLVGDWTDRIQKGDKIWWLSNSASRRNYVINISYSAGTGLTTITITSGYVTTANDSRFESGHAITEPYISHQENPVGFPTVFNYLPTMFGSTTPGIGTYSTQVGRFTIHGGYCHFQVYLVWTNHTGEGAIRFRAPVVSGVNSNLQAINLGFVSNYTYPSTYNSLNLYMDANSTTINLTAFKESGIADSTFDTAANFIFSGSYEI